MVCMYVSLSVYKGWKHNASIAINHTICSRETSSTLALDQCCYHLPSGSSAPWRSAPPGPVAVGCVAGVHSACPWPAPAGSPQHALPLRCPGVHAAQERGNFFFYFFKFDKT